MSKATIGAGLVLSVLACVPAAAEIRYITEEEAEAERLCILFKQKGRETEKELREATVAGGSVAGTVMEANAMRTKLRFQRDYYQRKIAEACADESSEDGNESSPQAAGSAAVEE